MRKNYWAVKHDKSHSKIYRTWIDMKSRCLNKNACQYSYYGGRGIKICDEWTDKEKGFLNFYNWAIQNCYSEELTLDRINVNGDYEPNNCRWATWNQQNINLRSTRNTSGYIGISKHSSSEAWYGRVKVNGQCIYTGISKNIHKAALMRNEYIISHNLENKLNEIKDYAS